MLPLVLVLLLLSIKIVYPPFPDCNIKRVPANVLNIISSAAAEVEKLPTPHAIPKL